MNVILRLKFFDIEFYCYCILKKYVFLPLMKTKGNSIRFMVLAVC